MEILQETLDHLPSRTTSCASYFSGGEDMLMEECIVPPAGNFPEFDFWLR